MCLKCSHSFYSNIVVGKQDEESTSHVKSVTTKVLSENNSEPHTNNYLVDGRNCDKGVNRRQKRIHLVTKPSDVWLHREGRVHETTFLDPQRSSERICNGKINKII